MKNVDSDRFIELTKVAEEQARHPGLGTLQDSIAGAEFALASFIGHLTIFDEKLNEHELLGLLLANAFLKELKAK